jgi:hypothetical protein
MSYVPTDIVTTEEEIRARFTGAHAAQQAKLLDHLDELCGRGLNVRRS